MTNSPEDNSSDVLRPYIFVDGDDVSEKIQLHRVVIQKAVNRIPSATLYILDGDMPAQEFPASDADDFAPGKKLKVTAAYGDQSPETIFEGIIVKHAISISGGNESMLVLECRDEAVKLTIGRKNANFIKQSGGAGIKDQTVMSTILGNYSGLKSTIGTTQAESGGVVQYNASDWDFLLVRAEANAMLVIVNDGEITIDKPVLDSSPVLTISYGQDLIEFEAELDARFQYKKVTGIGWDLSTHKVIEESVAASTDSSARGSLNGDLAKVVGLDDLRLQTQTPCVQQALNDWASSQQLRSQLSQLRGYVKFQGSGGVKVGDMLELQGVGSRFNGGVYVSSVEHELVSGNWMTQVEFGISQHWFSEREDISAPGASGLMPAVEGLQVGIVKQLDQDPDGQYRVMVSVPVLQADDEGIWARLTQFYASSGFGSFVIPEIDDEVVLGYFNNDPSCPVILGSLYSAKNTPPLELTAENYQKALVTKSKLQLQFDDEKKIITLETPGGHSFVMDDDKKSITITDSNNNKIEMNDSGINIDSPKDISLNAKGNIALKATGNIETTSTGDTKISATNIQQQAKAAFSAQGSASAEVKASGTTIIKGAMVMIN